MKQKTKPEQSGNVVWFPKDWTWPAIFQWLQVQNRDVDWWGQSKDGRPECHLKAVLK
jgi:hypothetical protein